MKRFFLISILILFGIFGIFRFQQSSVLKNKAEDFLKQGKAQEAVLLLQEARSLFPFNKDIYDDLTGANLILRSNLEYANIYEIGTELQIPPPVSYWRPLQPGEIFVPVLMYHHIRDNPRPGDIVWRVLNVSQKQLDDQLNYLSTHNFHAVSLTEVNQALNGQGALPENPVVLTFDDGYRNFYENAYPLLKKYNMKAVMFVITSVVNSLPYLTWDQIAEMDKSGLVEFGAHTRHHPNLPDLTKNMIMDEIKGSKNDLESHLKKPILWFAYPYGSYGSGNFIIETVKKTGFIGAVSTIYGAIQNKDNIYLMPRIGVDGRFTLDNLIQRITK